MAAPSTSDPHRPGATGPILLAAGLVLAAVLVFWPGIATYDSVVQYAQPLSGRYDDWHPPVMARLWSLTLHWISGAGPLLALQMAGYGLGLGLIAGRMRRLGRPRAALAVMLIGLWPPFLGWQAVVLKDAQMLGALLAAVGLIVAAPGRPAIWQRRVAIGVAAVLLLYALLVRANAVFAVAPLIAMLVPLRSARSRILLGVGLVAATLALSPAINHRLLGATESRVTATQPLYDLAGIAVRVGPQAAIGFTPAETRGLIARHCVRPFFWDPLDDDSRCAGIASRLFALPSSRIYPMLAEAAVRHPLAYLAQRLAHLNSTMRWWVPAGWINAAPPLGGEANDLGLAQPGWAAVAWERLAGWLSDWPTGWPIVWIVVAATMLAATRRSQDPELRLPRALLVSALALEASFAAFSIASDLRYHLWPMIATALAMATLPPGSLVDRRALRGGAAVLILVLIVGLAARLTLPAPPGDYAGMMG